MNTAINTGFLSAEDSSRVQSIMAGHGLSAFEASVRLWGRGKAIQVSGPLDERQLSCLLDIVRYLGEETDQAAGTSPPIAYAADAAEWVVRDRPEPATADADVGH
jgi:hypothetical protein